MWQDKTRQKQRKLAVAGENSLLHTTERVCVINSLHMLRLFVDHHAMGTNQMGEFSSWHNVPLSSLHSNI